MIEVKSLIDHFQLCFGASGSGDGRVQQLLMDEFYVKTGRGQCKEKGSVLLSFLLKIS